MPLILHQRYDEDSQIIWRAAVDTGLSVERVGFEVPSGDIERLRHAPVYGGWLWAQEVARQIGTHLVTPPDDWLLTVPRDLLRREIWTEPGAKLWTLHFPAFIKSLSGKSIASRVYHSASDLPPSVDQNEHYIVQEPVVWEREFRSFVVGGRVLTTSAYASRGRLCANQEGAEMAAEWLTAIISSIPLATSFVVDVGAVAGRGLAVVEANPAWCSGIYGCDPAATLTAVLACSVAE